MFAFPTEKDYGIGDFHLLLYSGYGLGMLRANIERFNTKLQDDELFDIINVLWIFDY